MSLITPYLYIGNMQNAQDQNFLKSIKVSLIVNCAKEVPNYFPKNVQYIRLELNDLPNQDIGPVLEPVANNIIHLMRNKKVVFVHCAAGISRSSSMVIYTIMKLHNWDYEKAFKFVKDLHPNTNPNPGFEQQLSQQHHGDDANKNKKVKNNHNNGKIRPKYEQLSQDIDSLIETPTEEQQIPENLIDKEGNNKWSKLTFDCKDCEAPIFTSNGTGHRKYAKIFS